MPKITYEDLLSIVKNEGTLSLASANSVVNQLLRSKSSCGDFEEFDYSDSSRKKLYEITRLFGNQEVMIYGIPDEYHNLAVSFAKADMHDFACEVIKRGLSTKPFSVDLLADYIRYGIFCERHDDCDQYFKRLNQIPLGQWNWRAFSFSIDYLLDKLNRTGSSVEVEVIRQKAVNLADRFIQLIGTDQAYFDKSIVLQSFSEGDLGMQKEVLTQGIKKLKVAPKCGLRLADILFEEGDYSNAAKIIKQCCLNLFKPQQDINGSYCFLLLALSNASALFQEDKSDYSGETDAILAIYKEFHTSLESGLNGVYKDTAITAVKVIAAQSGVSYPYTDAGTDFDY